MMNLSDDEFSVLMIAAEGAPMIPLGRWKPAVEHLVELGFLKPQPNPGDPSGNFNCVITPSGRKACEARDREDMDAFKSAVGKVLVTQPMIKRCPHCGGELDA